VALDVSENAVARTLALGVPRVEGVVADFEGWAIQTPFNIIIFNESLYYARDPEGVLLRYSKYLTEDGVIVVSIRQKWKNRSVWRSIERSFEARHRCCVTNVHRETWDVRVLTPRVPGQGPSPLQVPALA
jgi:trans-aconitate methyltransferase